MAEQVRHQLLSLITCVGSLEIHIIEKGAKSWRVCSDLYMQPWQIYTLTQTDIKTDRQTQTYIHRQRHT